MNKKRQKCALICIPLYWLFNLPSADAMDCQSRFEYDYKVARVSSTAIRVIGNREALSDVDFQVSMYQRFDGVPDHHYHEEYQLISISHGMIEIAYTSSFDARSFGAEGTYCGGTLRLKPITNAKQFDYRRALLLIAKDIERLKNKYPQLNKFSHHQNLSNHQLRISYGFNTIEPEKTGGWTSGVPRPSDDGIWFILDLHNLDSQKQLHSQPARGRQRLMLGNKAVTFLLLEGKDTQSIEIDLWGIFRKHGIHETLIDQ